MNICGDKHVYVYKTNDFWLQIKSAGMIIKCSEYLLTLVRRSNPEQLLKYNAPGPLVVGDVLIHPTAKIDSSAKVIINIIYNMIYNIIFSLDLMLVLELMLKLELVLELEILFY